MILLLILILVGITNPVYAQSTDTSLKSTVVVIPGGGVDGDEIDFDDLVFSPELDKVLVPAAKKGILYIFDPTNYSMSAIGGFSSSDWFQFWRGETGIFSAAEGKGFIFIPDHGKRELDVVNLTVGGVVGTANLAGSPDYVRYVDSTSEIWVTEPRSNQIEVFSFSALGLPMLRLSYVIPVSDGPESLVIDHINNKAYTNLGRETVAIDLTAHAIVSRWSNECQKSRGDAVDEQKGFLFVSCAEGKVSAFDINHGNKKVGSLAIDPGPDVISFNAKRSHLYVTSSANATLSVLWVSAQGELSLLAQAPTDKKAHCVVGDDQDNIWVCDPLLGQLLRFKDLL